MKKRIVSALLAAAIVLGSWVTVFATEAPPPPPAGQEQAVPLETGEPAEQQVPEPELPDPPTPPEEQVEEDEEQAGSEDVSSAAPEPEQDMENPENAENTEETDPLLAGAAAILPFASITGPGTVSSLFPDPVLAVYIAGLLGVGPSSVVTQNQLNSIRVLNPEGAVHSVEGIQYLNGLREARLDNLQLTERIPEAFVTDIYPNLSYYAANNQDYNFGTVILDNPGLQQIYDMAPPLFLQIAENSGGQVVGTWTILNQFNAVIGSIPAVNGSELLAFPDLDVGTHTIELVLNGNAWMGLQNSIYRFTVVFEGVTTGDLVGTVTGQNGQPLAGVSITAVKGDTTLTTTTDANGNYAFTGVATGTYTVTAAFSGYYTQQKNGTVPAGGAARVNFTLVQQIGSARVTVVDNLTGAPIPGAAVNIELFDGTGPTRTGTADANGVAVFNNLPAGFYRAAASAAGYNAGSQNLNVGAGATTEFTVRLDPVVYTLTIHVVDSSTGNGIPNATVIINGVQRTTDANGDLVLPGQRPGAYQGTAAAATYSTETGSITLQSDTEYTFELDPLPGTLQVLAYYDSLGGAPAPDVVITVSGATGSHTTDAGGELILPLRAGSYTINAAKAGYVAQPASQPADISSTLTETVEFVLVPITGSLQGVVYDDVSGQPLAGATVTLTKPDGTTETYGPTDATGAYAFSDVPYGTSNVSATAPGYSTDSKNISITTPGQSVTQNLTLHPDPGTLTVQVYYFGTSNPVAGADVELSDSHTGTTDAAGQVVFSLMPGEYTALATAHDYTSQPGSATLPAGGSRTITLYLHFPPAITGSIFDLDTRLTVAGATVELVQNGTVLATATADENGAYSFQDLAPGSYSVRVSAPGYQSVQRDNIVVPVDTVVNANFFLVPSYGALMGTVTYADGTPVPGILIELDNGQVALTDAEGFYSFITAEGEYTVIETVDDQEKDAMVQPDRTTVVNFVLPLAPGSLSGQVTDGTGAPLAGATVTVLVNGQRFTTTTDAAGGYRFDALPPGTYTVQAQKAGYGSAAQRVTIESGENTEADFVLSDNPGMLEGTVTDGVTGAPIAGAQVTIGPDGILVTTDENGYYSIPLVAGSYTVTAVVAGYDSQTQNASITQNNTTRIDFVFGVPPEEGGGGGETGGAAANAAGVQTGDSAAQWPYSLLLLAAATALPLLVKNRRKIAGK